MDFYSFHLNQQVARVKSEWSIKTRFRNRNKPLFSQFFFLLLWIRHIACCLSSLALKSTSRSSLHLFRTRPILLPPKNSLHYEHGTSINNIVEIYFELLIKPTMYNVNIRFISGRFLELVTNSKITPLHGKGDKFTCDNDLMFQNVNASVSHLFFKEKC